MASQVGHMSACYLVNRSLLIAIDFRTPQEVWYGVPCDYSGLREFGCLAYDHVNEGNL